MIRDTVVVIEPEKTLPISVTGSKCELNCRHCGGHYLRHMQTVASGLSVLKQDDHYSSVLISGGCDGDGQVLSAEHQELLREVADLGMRINAHPGLIGEQDIHALQPYVDVWSVDYVGAKDVARSVYGFDPGDRFSDLVRGLIAHGCRVVPHVCIGINGGEDSGEEQSLWELARLGARQVVLLVFIPAPGTVYADRTPPPLARIQAVFTEAVNVFGDQVTLGCMRPGGSYRQRIDEIALASGIRRIVRPLRRVTANLGQNVTIVRKKECCAL